MLLDLFRHAGWVAWPLGACSILALAIALERIFTLLRLRAAEDRAFAELRSALLERNDDRVRDPALASAPSAHVAKTLLGMRGATLESMETAADIAVAMQRMRLRRYLSGLATIGSTAPFIGLFGTVLGVMGAFQAMSKSGLSGEAMASGISEALSATALGLLVAIPSVILYNVLLGRVQAMVLQIQGHVSQLLPLIYDIAGMTPSRNGHHAEARGSHAAEGDVRPVTTAQEA